MKIMIVGDLPFVYKFKEYEDNDPNPFQNKIVDVSSAQIMEWEDVLEDYSRMQEQLRELMEDKS